MKYALLILLLTFIGLTKTNFSYGQTISVLPIPLTYCSCSPVSVGYTATGTYNIGNAFFVELSNAAGNFAAPVVIGTLVSNALNGNIPCVIPCNTPYGTGYRIRIRSNSPIVIGINNGNNITINPSPLVSIALTTGNCVDTLTAVVSNANLGVQQGLKYYITNSPPWGSPSNVDEMNAVFGPGNWIPANFSANAASIFLPGTQFVFLEGSDGNATALNNFVTANLTLIQNWVFAGGRLFLNAAPNVGGAQTWGFGGTTLNYQNLIPAIANAVPGVTIANVIHPINIGPYTPLDANGVYTANYFAHANVVNAGNTLIQSAANSNFSVLSEKTWGSGLVLFGGMTTSNWHNNVFPLTNLHAVNLRKNILHYTAGTVLQPPFTYTYLWSTGDTTQKILPAATGIYTVTVTASNGCTGTATYNYTAPIPIVVTIANTTLPNCVPGCNGTATTNVNGGILPYTYAISGGALISGAGVASNLCAGVNYTITATDANGCTGTTSVQLTTPNAPSLTLTNQTNISCFGVCNGSFSVIGVGGLAPYVYSIIPAALQAPSGYFSSLCANLFQVTVTDANGCTGTTNVTITQPPVLNLNISNITNVSCNALCNGTAQATAVGGTPGYIYSITAPGVINGTGAISGLCAGNYTVTVTDSHLCTATTSFTVTQPPVLNLNIVNVSTLLCNGNCNGTAQAIGSGGTPFYVYSITAPGSINGTGSISGLCAGTYTVTVTDSHLCTATTSFTVNQPPLLSATVSNVTNVTCFGLCNATAQIIGSGGTPAYAYAITAPGVINGTGAASALCAGTYTVTITDANLCTATTTLTVNQPPIVVTTITNSTNPSCTPGCDGIVTVSGSGGTGLITFSIIPNAGIIQNPAGTFTGLCAGTNYVITGTDANGCTGTTNISFSSPNGPTLNVSNITNVSCNGLCDGTAQASAVGGAPAYTYTITAPGVIDINTGAITALCAGTYTVSVTDANSCVSTTSFTVTEPNVLTLAINTTTPVSCTPGCDGTATTITAGGTAAYAYSISGGAAIDASGNATNLCAATVYTITVTDANNCTATTTIQLTAPNAPTVTVSNITNVTCNGLCNGTAQANGVGGLNPLSYTITAPGVIDVNTGAITGLCAGTYTVTVTDANLCTGTTSFTITEPALLTVSMSNIIDATCNGLCNGSAQATGLGGTNPLSYTITAPGVIDVNTGAATALCAGTYTVTVTDGNLCTATTSFTINEPTAVVTTVTASTNPTCTPGCDGSVTVSGSGGTGLIVFSIIPNAGIIQNPAGTFTGLCAGTNYVITGTDANGCTGTTNISFSSPNAPTVSVSNITNVSCNGVCDGTALASAAGGAPAYIYSITAPGVIDINTGAITALCAGSYTVTVTDANSCVGTTSFTVTEPNVLTVAINTTTPVSCVPGCDGTATTITAGGTAAYAYSISGGAAIDASGNATNLCAATVYTITVTDANNCTATTTIQLTAPNAPTVTVSNITNVTCNGLCNGTAQANGVGGLNPLSYTITAPGVIDVNTGAITGLCAGTYTVTVTDANLCTGTTSFTITEPALLTVSMSNIIDATCNGLCNGSAQATGLGGTNPLSYTITAPGVIDVNTGAATALCVGTYTVTVTDGNLCTATTSFTINEPTAVVTTVTASTNPTCTPGCDGSVTVSGSGGTGLIVFSIIPNAGIIQNPAGTFTGLCAGTNYVITGTDANGCTGTTNITLSTPNAPTASVSNITNVSCNGVCDGTAQAGAVGGTPGYTFAITAPGVIDINTGAITALCAGSYTVTVTDANSCVGTTSFTVTEPNVLTVDINTTTPVSCVPGCDGTATTITAGGTAAYAYSISGGAAIDASGNATNLCAATVYTITVTDANNCTATTTIQLTAPNAPTVTVSNITNVTCNGLCNGTAQANGVGGLNPLSYTITAPGVIDVNTGAITGLCAGTYTVTVTDANLCTGTTSFTITEPTLLTVSMSNIIDATCNGLCNGSAQATGLGGTNPLSYTISAPGVIDVNTGAATALCVGTYTVTVTDGNLCTATTSFTINEPTAVLTTVTASTNPTCTPGCDGSVTVSGSGGTGLIVFSIIPNAGIIQNPAGTFTGLCAGTNYVITCTDANGCTGTTNISLSTPNAPTASVSNITNVSCNGVCDGTAQAGAVGGTPAYTFAITAPGVIDINTGAITALCAGSYTVTVTDANSCVGTTSFTVTEPNVLTVDINTTTPVSCVPGCDGTATTITVGGTPAYVYSISGGAAIDAMGNATNLCSGITYTITVTDANNCTGTTTIQLTAPNAPTITINTTTPVTCVPGCDGTATTITAGGTPAYVYSISGGAAIDALGNATNLCAGTVYTITVTDANACTGTTTIQLTAPNAPSITINTTTPVTCVPGCDGTATTITAGGTPAYVYSISGGATIDALGNATNLCAGTMYTITVTDANACTGTTTIQLTAPNAPTITINTTTPVTCVPGCDGTATTITAGGTPAYVYSISGGATIDALGNATNLCAGTVYTITVTDANACTGTTTIQLTAPNAPTISINTTTPVTCVPGCDGTATTITAGGTPAYVYSISGGATIDALGNATNLCAGTVYTITVTDANACTGTTTIQLTAPNAPTITINTTTAPTCLPGCDGTATTITVGGTPAYVYSISGGATIDVLGNASNLCAGITYTITVTDANGCTGTTNISLSTPNAPTVSVSNITNVSCNGLCDGTAQAGAVGGTPGYTFAITAPGVIDINTGAITALCAGSYTVTVTDANSCVGTTSFTVTEPNVLTVDINTTTPVSCVPGCDGTATTITAGGTPAYAYSISGGAAIDVLGNATNLCSGITYTITVTDANNCTGTTTIQLTAPNAPTISINTTTPVSCVPGCDGTATTITAGGTPAYVYSISGGAAIDALGNATNLCSRYYIYNHSYRCKQLYRNYNHTVNGTECTNDNYQYHYTCNMCTGL
ncbi:MAG: hypothetical protein IPH46_02930 [Bacteroidetes bacterium]|nr:hypothetical protein [Bacteroidota bacterium]